MRSARYVIYELLMKMERGAYSNIALDSVLSSEKLSPEDRRFVSRVFYGVTERKITLDYIITQYSKTPPEKLDREVLTVLRMGLYQLMFCDSVPDSAAVNESVKLIKEAGKGKASGFVNGLLRNFIRSGCKYELPEDKISSLSVKYSCREDIVRLLLDGCGEENAVSLLEASFLEGDMTARVNTLKISAEGLMKMISESGGEAVPCGFGPLSSCALEIRSMKSGDLSRSVAYKDGLFHIQDISSQICCLAVAPDENDTVIDVCAAPGGKSFTLSEMMNGKGSIISCELHKNRAALIEKGAKRLGLHNITAVVSDGRKFNERLPLADKVLCDVPCSGLGVMRGKPEIKYKDPDDFKGLPQIQYDILQNASKYVKSGGVLVYSTCTVNPAENDGVTKRFLESHPDFYGVPFLERYGEPFGGCSVTVFPKHFGSDGFYICKMMKK
ncbi:MAG: 16S rRNA (cytosine(967)-C(5))-methyltransferase RsmB [Oscillospiraceae bacterium]|nr:16S rRNA (cytosine(967)-C(5))-methyltransferase RsmB [Oscillospiraceae bacterium]